MVGDKIREIRKKQSVSLAQLASRVGVSDSYISQLERNAAEPSVSVLRKISSALNVPVSIFFDEEFEPPILVRGKNREENRISESGIRYAYLSPQGKNLSQNLQMVSFHISANSHMKPHPGSREICIYLLKGKLSVHLEERVYEMKEGDSIYIRKNVTYYLTNSGTEDAEGIASIACRS